MDWNNEVKDAEEILKADWCEDPALSKEYFAYRHEFVNILTWF